MSIIRNEIPLKLLEELEVLFKETLPTNISFSDREVAFKMGQSHVVKLLRLAHDEQNQSIIEDN
jgi:hypothetical protein